MKPVNNAYIALGSNLNNPKHQVLTAIDLIHALPDCTVTQRSSLHLTAPVGYLDQPDFINAVIKVETSLAPLELLHALQKIEIAQGRIRTIKNGPRTIDLDLILYEGVEMDSEELTLPHPRMQEREFVMGPLNELCKQPRELSAFTGTLSGPFKGA